MSGGSPSCRSSPLPPRSSSPRRCSARPSRSRRRPTSPTRSSRSSIVVALYVFIGNSGVLSFGHISFVAVGAWTAGVLSVPAGEKPAIMPNLAHFLVHRNVGNITSLVLAAVVGGVFALLVGMPADAALRTGGRHRHVRRARDHAQPPALRGADRPWPERVLVGSRDDRAAPGRARCARRGRRRVRLRAQPLRATVARDARGRRRRARDRRVGLQPAADRLHGLGAARRARRRPLRPSAAACRPSRSTST